MEFLVATPFDLLGPPTAVEEKNAPDQLWIAGDRNLLDAGPRVSVVGTREVSREGLSRTVRLVRKLVERDMVVVSGLAQGVDTAAHEAAIEARGKTIAVLGTPLEVASPARNRALQDRLAREHLVISQFAPGTPVQRHNFPLRNRTMALFSDATVIVEAGPKSGTEHQAWEALRLGRLLFVLQSVADSGHEWVGKVLHYGAQVLTDENVDVALENMPERGRVQELPF